MENGNFMKIEIEVSTEENAETIRAIAQMIETGSINGIQHKGRISNCWHDYETGDAISPISVVRRKPAPTYRPWTPEEAIGKAVVDIEIPGVFYLILKAGPLSCQVGDTGYHGYVDVLRCYTQLDGSPCGVLEGGES